tara:strand:+ start:4790 stop:5131 length:342 start_codon:yes stop_codon:yes gene_type:complete
MSEDTMLDQAIKDIVNVMTSLAGLKSTLEDRREDRREDKPERAYLEIREISTDPPVRVIEVPPLNKPEEGKVYSLLELSKTKKWSESEVEPYTQEIDVFDIDYDEEDLFADIK